MKQTTRKLTKLGCAAVVALAVGNIQVSHAGWTGAMNGEGFGQAGVNVTSSQEKVRIVNTTNMYRPSASINPYLGYVFTGLLPTGSSKATVAKVYGTNGYVWQATTVGSNGDSTDNARLDGLVDPAECANLDMWTHGDIAPDNKSGTYTINAIGTLGTALASTGIEVPEGYVLVPDDPATENINETLEDLKAVGLIKWDVVLVGPFDLNETNCTQMTFQWVVKTNASKNLFVVTDGVAKSLPLVVYCPPDVTVACDAQPVAYPPVQFAGCGDITVTYDPPAGTVFPLGVNPVTVTVTDRDTNTTTCTFNVIVTGLQFQGFYPPIGTVYNTCSKTSAVVVNSGSVAPLKFDMFCGTTKITAGTAPTFDIQPVLSNCNLTGTATNVVAEYQNDWHYNWDTTGWEKTTYKVTLNLPDGITKPYVFIRIK